jgi:hypothetical protein
LCINQAKFPFCHCEEGQGAAASQPEHLLKQMPPAICPDVAIQGVDLYCEHRLYNLRLFLKGVAFATALSSWHLCVPTLGNHDEQF